MPKTREQFQEIKDERRDSIIIASTFLFSSKGYKNLTIDDITTSAKCSHGLFYHYFSNKEEVFRAVMEKAVKTIHKFLGNVDLDGDPNSTLNEIINGLLNMIKSSDYYYSGVVYLLCNLRLQKDVIPPPKSKNPDRKPPLPCIIKSLIEKGEEKGLFVNNNAKEITVVILAMISGLAYNRLWVGPEKFCCPNSELIMNIVRRREK